MNSLDLVIVTSYIEFVLKMSQSTVDVNLTLSVIISLKLYEYQLANELW